MKVFDDFIHEFLYSIASQFNSCPLVWICHHRSVNNKINLLHEICISIVFSYIGSTFEDLLDRKTYLSQCE